MSNRLDQEMVQRGLVSSRARARFLLERSLVKVNGILVKKLSRMVNFQDKVEILADPNPWVSRGALKLDFAVKEFKLCPLSGIALDIGASTGGFTDVLLQYGCSKVYAVDVGKNQLHKKFQSDRRVVNLEGINARNMRHIKLPKVDLIVCDVSFISLDKVLSEVFYFAKIKCQLIALVKPQFEVGAKNVGKKGMVKNPILWKKACDRVKTFLVSKGWKVLDIKECPIRGSSGAVEFIILATNEPL